MKKIIYLLVLSTVILTSVQNKSAAQMLAEDPATQVTAGDPAASATKACICTCGSGTPKFLSKKGYYAKPDKADCSTLNTQNCLVTGGTPVQTLEGKLVECKEAPKPIPAAADAIAADRCGDGVFQATEECDDGNNANGDGCSSVCRLE